MIVFIVQDIKSTIPALDGCAYVLPCNYSLLFDSLYLTKFVSAHLSFLLNETIRLHFKILIELNWLLWESLWVEFMLAKHNDSQMSWCLIQHYTMHFFIIALQGEWIPILFSSQGTNQQGIASHNNNFTHLLVFPTFVSRYIMRFTTIRYELALVWFYGLDEVHEGRSTNPETWRRFNRRYIGYVAGRDLEWKFCQGQQ